MIYDSVDGLFAFALEAMEGETLRAQKASEKAFARLRAASEQDLEAFGGQLESQEAVKASARGALAAARADLKGAEKVRKGKKSFKWL